MYDSNFSRSALAQFSESYARIHGRIAFPLTIFGILTSIVTIIILHRKNFRTPTNLILQHVAFFDTIVLISFNIYSLYFYILREPNPFVGQSQFWPRFAIFHSNIGLTAHTIALWLTGLLAIIRYAIISKPNQVKVNSRDVIILIWMIAVIICLLVIPNYFIWSVVLQPAHTFLPHLYSANSSEMVYWHSVATGSRLERIAFVIFAIGFKIFPVVILIIFGTLLIINIRHARQLRERLRRYSAVSSTSSLKRELRTTTMLVFITLFTVLVELPQGLFFIASGINKDFFYFYSQLGDIWDITSIGSSFITFIMYCSMSQQFRVEICHLLLPSCLTNRLQFNTKNVPSTNGISLKPRGPIDNTVLLLPRMTPASQDL